METNTSALQAFTCRTSTFLVLPIFQFALHYSDGTVQKVPYLDLALTETSLNTTYGRLSMIWKGGGEAERSLELREFHNITRVTCMVRLVNSTKWFNETLALPITHLGKKGNWHHKRVSSSTVTCVWPKFLTSKFWKFCFERCWRVNNWDLRSRSCHPCNPTNCYWVGVYTSTEDEVT